VAVVGLLAVFAGYVAAADAPSPWVALGTPTIQKTIDLPANSLPSQSNFDCIKITTSNSVTDCVVTTPLGMAGVEGYIFAGSTNSIPVVPGSPFNGLQPIPNQMATITYSSAPVVGSYIHFYKTIRDKLSAQPVFLNGRLQYTIVKNPEVSIRDSAGKLLPANPSAMAFSPNGNWLIVDLPWQGFVRINLATFQITPFAPSMNQGTDYASYGAQLSISNDGHYAVVKPSNQSQFNVYDINNCTGTTLPVVPGTDRCSKRDYWNVLDANMPGGIRALYQPRYMNNSQIGFSAIYDYVPGNFKTAKFTLTAPGESTTGISYMGMGDSFASGEGAFEYTTETDTNNNECHLSARSYPFLVNSQLFSGGHSIACSGAKTSDIYNQDIEYKGQVADQTPKNQRLPRLLNTYLTDYTPGYLPQSEFIDTYRPEVISLSVGGNDIGFSDIVSSCVSPFSLQESCFPTYEDRLELARQINNIFDKLVATYQTVAKPGKRVYVVGYPQMAATNGNCAVNVNLDGNELLLASDLIEYLNTVINRAADRVGVRYVDVSDALNGHRLCETNTGGVAVNGVTAGNSSGIGPFKFLGSESFHPNGLGHQLLDKAILTKTSNLTQSMPAANSAIVAPPLPSTLDQRNLPKSGRTTNTVIAGTGIAPRLVTRDQDVNVVLDASIAVLKALTTYLVFMRSTPVELGKLTTDSNGELSGIVRIPASIEPGIHTLHIYGPNMTGQPIDITSTLYVAASATDYNGDGVPNTTDPCPTIQPAAIDVDKDGVDDACDAIIGDPPPLKLTLLTSKATLTGNTITLSK